jgi:hypothetical protein
MNATFGGRLGKEDGHGMMKNGTLQEDGGNHLKNAVRVRSDEIEFSDGALLGEVISVEFTRGAIQKDLNESVFEVNEGKNVHGAVSEFHDEGVAAMFH